MKIAFITFLLLSSCLLALPTFNEADQINNLDRLIKSKRSSNPPRAGSWVELLYATYEYSPVYTAPQNGMMEADKILSLPGQPEGVDFDQYAGYVTVDPKAGRALFYYFVESPQDSSTKPLVLWLNGGPGCSSFGYGAMAELGPFRINSDGKTLFRNENAWNNVANILFLESPAGVGYSFSNTYSDYNHTGDQSTAKDAYAFLVNWLERFPQYKTRDFFIAGESYAGHYVPQLAYTVLLNNKNTNQTIINLKGIAIGNAWIDDTASNMGMYDYAWTHALISDETNAAIHGKCDFFNGNFSVECVKRMEYFYLESGDIDIYNIYAPLCHNDKLSNGTTAGSIHIYDPCYGDYVNAYLNLPEVQRALHANATKWQSCRSYNWIDSPTTVLPIIQQLIQGGIRVWIYSGDVDARVPVTASRYSINSLKLSVEKPWYPWYTNQEVGGYVVAYKGVTFVTVRGAGHLVPMDKPERSLVMISSFLQGKLPPAQ